MVVLDADIVTDRVPVAFDEGIRFSPVSRPERQPVDPWALYERERARADREQARADAAEARCEELRWAEVAARSDAGSWKSQFRKCRDKLTAAEEETKELRRATRQAPSLQAGVVRLETRLSEVGVESSESSTIKALHKELARLRNENTKLLAALEARDTGSGIWSTRPVSCAKTCRERRGSRTQSGCCPARTRSCVQSGEDCGTSKSRFAGSRANSTG